MTTLYLGDCLDILPTFEAGAADVLICDPPAAIGFMGAEWDHHKGGRAQWVAWLSSILAECYRILPAGACGLVWALPRTSHWTALACEDAGFQIVDRIAHVFSTGFPKHKHALKPAVEDWWLLQKPGAARRLNVEDCRIATDERWSRNNRIGQNGAFNSSGGHVESNPAGRWPAHLVLSHAAACNGVCAEGCPIKALGEQSGERSSPATYTRSTRAQGEWLHSKPAGSEQAGFGDTGTAARFFTNLPPFIYAAKASRRERNAGCEGMQERVTPIHNHKGRDLENPRNLLTGGARARVERGETARIPAANHHPTVKSLALMQWLVRLIAPPGGVVLDPFMGSGSTGCAAILEGREFVGIEQNPEYYAIAEARIAHAGRQKQLDLREAAS